MDSTLNCTESGCEGTSKYAYNDPVDGPNTKGLHEDGTAGCATAPGGVCTQNICNSVTCDNGEQPCTDCTEDNDPACGLGHRCNNGCCGPLVCNGIYSLIACRTNSEMLAGLLREQLLRPVRDRQPVPRPHDPEVFWRYLREQDLPNHA